MPRVRNGGGLEPVVAVFSGGGTGGHLYPALNLARGLKQLRPDVETVFVGARRGLEARILPQRDMEFHLLPVRGVARGRVLSNLGVLPDLIRSVLQVSALYRRLRPRLVVVTGGYAGGPAGLAARLHGVPLVLQEQNAHPGATTRMLSRWARQVHLAFPEARDHLPRSAHPQTRVTGNPVSPPLTGEAREVARRELRAELGVPQGVPLMLAVGGSQGSRALNQGVLAWLRRLSELPAPAPAREPGLHLLWSTGPNLLEEVLEGLEALGSPPWVHVQAYLDHMPQALAAADLALSRAGAMATSEFLAWGTPAVLVPLPTAAANHQHRNAEALEGAGAARLLPEVQLSGASLEALLRELLDHPEQLLAMGRRARAAGRPGAMEDAVRSMAELLPPAREAA
ncbi:MAG: UDP-N-acetylglucosamine--N-acetylmuramyl-(pentapeptide) pyrophosphoryl-undecaprenol N-acetylglucosamine transferase [Gemmatimonadota bacterium]